MTKPKVKAKKAKKSLDDTGSYKVLKVNPVEAEKAVAAAPDLIQAEWKRRAMAAESVLDIIVRENAGEPDEDLAAEYGGTGYEKHPAVVSARAVRLREAQCQAALDAVVKLLDARVQYEAQLEAWTAEAVKTGQVNFATVPKKP